MTAKLWCNNYDVDGFLRILAIEEKLLEDAMPFASEADMKEVLVSGKNVIAAHAWERCWEDIAKKFWPMDSHSKE